MDSLDWRSLKKQVKTGTGFQGNTRKRTAARGIQGRATSKRVEVAAGFGSSPYFPPILPLRFSSPFNPHFRYRQIRRKALLLNCLKEELNGKKQRATTE